MRNRAVTRDREAGVALLSAILVLMLMSAILVGFITMVNTDQAASGINRDQTQAYAAAHAGVEKLTSDLGNYFQTNFRSNYAGWRASVHVKNGVDWVDFWGLYDTNWYYLSYTDYNSHSLIVLCLDNGKTYWCGWGANAVSGSGVQHTYSGTNDGY